MLLTLLIVGIGLMAAYGLAAGALTVAGRHQSGHCPMGQNGRIFQWGVFTFTAADATGELPVLGRSIEHVSLTPLAAPNTDEQLYVDEAQVEGRITVPATGAITIGRTGTKTSGLTVSYYIVSE